MKQLEDILSIERNQGSTIKTMERLIKQSKRHQQCFMCKTGLSNAQLTQISTNFNTESEKAVFEQKQKGQLTKFE